MPEFEIGDRVICRKGHDGNNSIIGKRGMVCRLASDNVVGVDFDMPINLGHDCRKAARMGHGWYVSASALELELPDITTPLDIKFHFDTFMNGDSADAE